MKKQPLRAFRERKKKKITWAKESGGGGRIKEGGAGERKVNDNGPGNYDFLDASARVSSSRPLPPPSSPPL